MKPLLAPNMFRPEDGDMTVAEIVNATLSMAAQARQAHKLDPDRVLILTVPYDPQRRDSWQDAEKRLPDEPGGKNIRFDWTSWDVWTVPRGDLGTGVPSGWYIRHSDGGACLPAMLGDPRKSLSADELRDLAAEALAMADHLDNKQGNEISLAGCEGL